MKTIILPGLDGTCLKSSIQDQDVGCFWVEERRGIGSSGGKKKKKENTSRVIALLNHLCFMHFPEEYWTVANKCQPSVWVQHFLFGVPHLHRCGLTLDVSGFGGSIRLGRKSGANKSKGTVELWNTGAERLLSAFAANTVDSSVVPRVLARPCYDNVACNWTHLMDITLPPVATWKNKRARAQLQRHTGARVCCGVPTETLRCVSVVPTFFFFMRADKAVKRNHKQYYVNCWTCFCCSVLLTGFFTSMCFIVNTVVWLEGMVLVFSPRPPHMDFQHAVLSSARTTLDVSPFPK